MVPFLPWSAPASNLQHVLRLLVDSTPAACYRPASSIYDYYIKWKASSTSPNFLSSYKSARQFLPLDARAIRSPPSGRSDRNAQRLVLKLRICRPDSHTTYASERGLFSENSFLKEKQWQLRCLCNVPAALLGLL